MKRRLMAWLLAILALPIVGAPGVATATQLPELTQPLVAYRSQQAELTEVRRLMTLRAINGPYTTPAGAAAGHHRLRPQVERWRPLVEWYFPADRVDWAMRVMACESGGDPLAKNPHSSARGLFQHLARYWPERAVAAGWAGADIFDPQANTAVAAWLLATGGPGHWVCRG